MPYGNHKVLNTFWDSTEAGRAQSRRAQQVVLGSLTHGFLLHKKNLSVSLSCIALFSQHNVFKLW